MYYNAHTHHTSQPTGVVSIVNVLNNFSKLPEEGYCSTGLHPWHLAHFSDEWPELVQAATKKNVIAIGECGLDKITETPWQLQIDAFNQQINLAKTLGKPLIIHCVRAYSEVMSLLRTKQVSVPVIFHGFNRGMNVAKPLVDNGYILSFGAHILQSNNTAATVLQQIPSHQFILETDDKQYPIELLYKQAAEIRKTTEDAIILQVGNNFKKLFGIS